MTLTHTPEHRNEKIEEYMERGLSRAEAEAHYRWAFPGLSKAEIQVAHYQHKAGIFEGPLDRVLPSKESDWFVAGDDFVAQELEPRSVFMSDKETGATVFYQASLNQIFATRGLGKSIVTNALLKAFIGGKDFLRLTSPGGLSVLHSHYPIGLSAAG